MTLLDARAGRRQFLTAAGIVGGSLAIAPQLSAGTTSGAAAMGLATSANHLSLSTAERDRRWAAIRAAMKQAGVDVLLLTDQGGGVHPVADIRYLAGFARVPLALLFFAGTDPEVFTGGLEYAKAAMWMRRLSWVEKCEFAANRPQAVADRLAKAGKSLAIGIKSKRDLEPDMLAALEGVSLVEVGDILQPIRAVKSAEELAMIRYSAGIADRSMAKMLQRVNVGSPQYALHVEAEAEVFREGAEGNSGNHYVFQDGEDENYSYGRMLLRNPIRKGDFAVIEVSPDYNGYHSQLTAAISFGPPREKYVEMYRVSVEARRAGLELLKPGGNLRDVALRMKAVTEANGLVMADYAAGHVTGLALTEQRVSTTVDYELKPGMSIVLHAVTENNELDHVLKADTYFITNDGHIKVNTFSEEINVI